VAAHAPDDPFADAEPKAGAAIVLRDALVRLLELLKNTCLSLRRDADAGVAHHEQHVIGQWAGLDDERDAAALRELDRIAGEIEQHLPQPSGVADHVQRQPFIDIGGDLEVARLRARRQQFGDAFDQAVERERPLFEVDLAGFDLGKIEQLLDQRQQRFAGGPHRLGVGRLLRRQRGVEQQPVHADNAVQRRADFVRDHGEEARFGAARRIGLVARLAERARDFGAVGDIATDALDVRGLIRVGAHQTFPPADPSCAGGAGDLLVMDARAGGIGHDLALLEDRKFEAGAEESLARLFRQRAIGVVDEPDGAVCLSQHDEIVLRFEQDTRPLLGLLQFPVAVDQRLVSLGDDAQFSTHPAQPHAGQGQRDACHREKKAGADGESMGVVAGGVRPDAGDEAVGAAESRLKQDGCAEHEIDAGMPAGKAAQACLDAKHPSHRSTPSSS